MTKTISTKEAREISGKPATAIRYAIARKEIKATKKGGSWVIDEASLKAWMKSVQTPTEGQDAKPEQQAPSLPEDQPTSEIEDLKAKNAGLTRENDELRQQLAAAEARQCGCGCECGGKCTGACRGSCGKKCSRKEEKRSLWSLLFPKH